MENFFVRAALFHAFDELVVIDSEKTRAARVESAAEVRLVIRRQEAFGVLPNFVQHPAEINESADFRVRAAQSQFSHRQSSLRFFRAPFKPRNTGTGSDDCSCRRHWRQKVPTR